MRLLGRRLWLWIVLACLLVVAASVSALQRDWLIALAAVALLVVQVIQIRSALRRRNDGPGGPPSAGP